ncbi:hypothetical protein OAG04_00070 [bacterium]|nr:hypothetical protein [bacterium]
MSEYFVGSTGANNQTNFSSLDTSEVLDDLGLNTGDAPTFSGLFINSTGTGANNTLFSVDGSNGRLFGVTDEVTGTVFSVNDAAGLPIVEVESTSDFDKITIGEYGSDLLVLSGQTTAEVTGSQIATQSWISDQGFSADTNYYLTGVSKSGNTFTFEVNGASDPTYTLTSGDITGALGYTPVTLEDDGSIEAEEFIGDLRGAVSFKAQAGEAIAKGEAVFISGISGNTTVVALADANDATRMPAFGIASEAASANNPVTVINFGSLGSLDTDTPNWDEGDELFVSNTAGELTTTPPTSESSLLQKIAKVTRRHASSGSITVMGAGRTNAVPNLNEGRLFVGNSSNEAVADDTAYVDIANSRVGIGTTSPSQKLQINGVEGLPATTGTSQNALLRLTPNAPTNGESLDFGMRVNGSDSVGWIQATNFGNLGSNYDIAINPNGGNVGIGITSPNAKLDIVSTGAGSEGLRVDGASGGFAFVVKAGSDYTSHIRAGATIGVSYFTTPPSNGLIVQGNVGIGTTSPSNFTGLSFSDPILDVAGPIQSRTGNVALGGSSYRKAALFTSTGSDAPYLDFRVASSGTSSSTTVRMRIDENGNVGIGTTNPEGLLQISRDASTAYDGSNDSGQSNVGASLTIQNPNTTINSFAQVNMQVSANSNRAVGRIVTIAKGGASSDMAFVTENAGVRGEKMRVDYQGNVGIGTTSPNQLLEIDGGTGNAFIQLSTPNDRYGGIAFGDPQSATAGRIQYYHGDNSFQFDTDGKFTFEGGDFGIGTNAPATRLDVYKATSTTGSSTGTPLLRLHNYVGSDLSQQKTFIDFTLTDDNGNETPQVRIGAEVGQNGDANSQAKEGCGAFVVYTNNADTDSGDAGASLAERMRVDYQGNVGIGTTSPSAKLELKGSTADSTANAFVARDSASASLFSIRNDGRVDATGDLVVGGNLTVNGTTSTINSTTLQVDDKNIELGTVATPTDTTADGGGITLKGATDKTINWVNSTDAWTFSERIAIPDGTAAAPSLTFSNDTDTGLFRELSGTSELISFSTEGTKRVHISSAGIFSQANVYSASGGQFRNFSGVWKATTGTTGNGFQFISADATALTISSTGDTVASGTVKASSYFLGSSTEISLATTGAGSVFLRPNGQSTSGQMQLASTGNATFAGSVTATSLVKSGGSSAEFLKADGSVDSNTYLTTSSASSTYLPLAGGTMSGDLNIAEYIRHDQDSNTYLRFTADTLRLAAGGVEMIKLSEGTDDAIIFNEAGGDVDFRVEASGEANALFVRGSDGDVGIGTTSPSYKLSVSGGDFGVPNGSKVYIGGAVGDSVIGYLGNTSGKFTLNSDGNRDVIIGSGTVTNAIFIKGTDGNVGIGTNNPSERLHIHNSTGNGATIRLSDPDSTSTANATGYVEVYHGENTSRAGYFGLITNSEMALATTTSAGNIKLYTGNNTAALTIDSSQRVGIGTTSPDYQLDIENSSHATARLHAGANSSASLRLQNDAQHFDVNLQTNDKFAIYDHTAGTQPFTILPTSGNVGIGITDPDTELEVGGTIKASTNADAIVIGSPTTVKWKMGVYGANDLLIRDPNNNTKFSILSGGNVGIGTASPDSLLEIENAPAAQTQTRMLSLDNNPSSNQGSGYIEISSGTNNQAKTQIEQVSSGGFGLLGNQYLDTNIINKGLSASSHGNINFATGSSTSATSIVMTIGGGSQKGNVGIGTTTPSAKLEVNGHFAATTKSFIVDNPKTGGKLQYGVVESDQHSVFVRGKNDTETIELPEEWEWLVDEDSVTVDLTSIGQIQQLFVVSQDNKTIKIGGLATNGKYNYTVYGERKDVEKLEVNI